MSRLTDHDKTFGPLTIAPWSGRFTVEWCSGGGYWEPRNFFMIVAFGWAFRLFLPNILKPYGERYDTHPRTYGFSLSNMGNGYDFFQLFLGPQTHDSLTTKQWSKHLPWMQWDCVRHSLYTPDGHHFYTEPHWKIRQKLPSRAQFEFFDEREKCPKVHFGFEDYDGEMIIATCHLEEREWHKGTGWFRWLKWFSKPKIRRDLSLEFDHEVGPEKGSWKGGTTGHGIDMQPGETPEDAFKRYCQMEHERKGRKYKLRFIGKSGPPEPREIRVARARGWKQCDYPHTSAKDMWHHPDATPCGDGHYINTEEMLEYVKAEQDEQNAQCGMNMKADAA